MHSDGYIVEILPDLIEIGIDALNAQLFCMDIEKIGKKLAGKITCWGEIDRQYILPHGTQEEVINAVKRVHSAFYRNGGIIAQIDFGPGDNPKNVITAFKTFEEFS